MTEQIKIGSTLKWTLQSPKETGVDNSGFYEFRDDNFIPEGAHSHILGVVVYISDGSAIIQVTDMTSDMFPFALFYNEVKNRFLGFEVKGSNPYQKYFCLDLTTMVSLFYYYEGEGFLNAFFSSLIALLLSYPLERLLSSCLESQTGMASLIKIP